MPAKRNFSSLGVMARELGYGVGRRGRDIFWWRNEDPDRMFSSSCIRDAWEDIILDHSSKKHLGRGTAVTTPGEET